MNGGGPVNGKARGVKQNGSNYWKEPLFANHIILVLWQLNKETKMMYFEACEVFFLMESW